jgi:hypothetical protein
MIIYLILIHELLYVYIIDMVRNRNCYELIQFDILLFAKLVLLDLIDLFCYMVFS